ncbi:MAG: glycogen synthase [Patescibacteria group bacterium]|nr:glycogen synthase [Patescibacteria group bacterium]
MNIFQSTPKLKVLFVASEAAPFVKAGGLGEVMFSLPRALRDIGYDARVMIPRYAGIDQEKFTLKMEQDDLHVPTDRENDQQAEYLVCNVRKYESDEEDGRAPVTAYFLENQEYFENRSNVYGYGDDAVRWALLSRGVLEFLRVNKKWTPDVIVAADWQAAFVINYLKTAYKDNARLSRIATVFSIHNLYYQGMFDHRFVSEMDFDDGKSPIPSLFNPRLLKINMMRRGILYADAINTVSPTYAREIMTAEYGEMLDGLLRERRSVVYGILNGIDYHTVNPETDPHLVAQYGVRSIRKRAENKEHLQDRFGLPVDKDKFVIGIVSRLDGQKGFDLLFDTLEPLIRQLDFQLVVVGSGDSRYMGFFDDMSKRFPKNIGAHLSFDLVLPRLIFGGADAILIPSKFEPSGLTQMEAMRYGAVPIVRKTGGLADTVEDYDPEKNVGTGFVFNDFEGFALTVAVTRAFTNYRHRADWLEIQKRGMEKDFSWEHSAREYGKLFSRAYDIRMRDLGHADF